MPRGASTASAQSRSPRDLHQDVVGDERPGSSRQHQEEGDEEEEGPAFRGISMVDAEAEAQALEAEVEREVGSLGGREKEDSDAGVPTNRAGAEREKRGGDSVKKGDKHELRMLEPEAFE